MTKTTTKEDNDVAENKRWKRDKREEGGWKLEDRRGEEEEKKKARKKERREKKNPRTRTEKVLRFISEVALVGLAASRQGSRYIGLARAFVHPSIGRDAILLIRLGAGCCQLDRLMLPVRKSMEG